MDVRVYTAKDGLPSTYVYGASEDKLGYLWIGTPDGLSRFDGQNFINYGVAEGLPDPRTAGMMVESTGRYWAVTARGMVEFKANKFINYPLSDQQKLRGFVQLFQTKEGHLWSLTPSGLYQFNINKWDKIQLNTGYQNRSYRSLLETTDGLYINYGNLLLLKTPQGFIKIIGPPKNPGYYYNNLSFSDGRIFLSTLDGMYQIKNQVMIKLPGILGKLKGIYVYYHDSKNRFWIGRSKIGIQMLPANDSTHLVTIYPGPVNFLPQTITEDNKGNIWVGSGNGLIKISEKNFKIFETENFLGNTVIRNVMQFPRERLLLNNGTLTLKSFENNVFNDRQLILKSKTALPNNEMIIDNYAFDNKGRYWYYLRGFSLAMQQGNNVYELSREISSLGDEVFDVMFDFLRKKIIIAVRTQPFPCQYNDTTFTLFSISNKIEIKGSIRLLHQCVNGTILFSTDQGFIYSIDKNNFCSLQLHEFNEQGNVSKFYNDPSGDTWIIYTGRGVRRYSWQKGSLIFEGQIDKTNGLSSDNTTSLCFDNNKNLWVSTNSDVSVFTKTINSAKQQTYKLLSYYDTQDLQIQDSYGFKLLKDKKGNIWLFSAGNLICFYPDKLNYKPAIPYVQIENVELNLRQTNWADYDDSLSGIFQLPVNPGLSHKNNTLGFYFKGISSSGTDGIRYSYQLEGLNDQWSTTTTNDFVSFVKLPPGKYVFKVKAQLRNTEWSTPAFFPFEIKKAFWQTWLFFILAGLVLSAGIYILFRYRLLQKIKLLEMRNSFTQDLHDEIGSSVSGINLLSQMASEKLNDNKPAEAAEYLFKVKNYTQEVIEKLSDMVWVFNPQNDSIEKLLQRLKSFTLSIASSKNIEVHFATDKEREIVNLSIRQRKAIYLISKEAINNCFKYAECSSIYYTLYSIGSKWQLQIRDDGKGFIPTENNKGNGLKNMYARAAEINAKFSIQSQPRMGTIIIMDF